MSTYTLSPRIVPLALFNPASYIAGGYTGTNGVAKVMNLVGFFVEGMCDVVYPVAATRPVYCGTPAEAGKMVVGRLMNYPGQGSGSCGLSDRGHVYQDHPSRQNELSALPHLSLK